MRHLKLVLVALVLSFTTQINAQTVDEIIETYIENTGGRDAWSKVEGIRMTAKASQGGMEIPIEIYQLKDGRQMTIITFQGLTLKQGVFDGETLWGTNFQTQKAEKSDQESTDNFKKQVEDFPNPFFNYKEKGYTLELLGKETIDGAETFKVKLTMKPLIVDGQEEENVSFYYFDTENFVPIVVHSEIKSGPGKGKISEIKMSDYQEVEGLYFPFALAQGIKDGFSQSIMFDKIELNPEVDDEAFKYPEDATTETKDEEKKEGDGKKDDGGDNRKN